MTGPQTQRRENVPKTYADVGWKQRDTAEAAAKSVSPKAPILRDQVVATLKKYGPHIADDIAILLRRDKLSIRPRCSELASSGIIRDSGQRRKNTSGKNAVVWEIVPKEKQMELF
jgi:hypothetical protein